MRKKSSILLTISLILLIGLGSTSFFIVRIIKSLEYDAKQINEIGIIRGSIQRLTKHELYNRPDDELINRIDDGLKTLSSVDNLYIQSYSDTIAGIADIWEGFKLAINDYRSQPSIEKSKIVFETSELLWTHTSQAVYLTQRTSEMKILNFKFLFPILFINIALILTIAMQIKRYVRDQLEQIANYDALTKVYNRNFLYNVLDSELSRSDRYNKDFGYIIFDIDNFKKVNDNYGHDIGDLILIQLCRLCEGIIRKSDILGRLGGEEFVILAPETNLENSLNIAEKIRKAIEEYEFSSVGHITVSIGVAQYVSGDSRDTLYKRADIALYKAKYNGKNRIEVNIKGADLV